MVTVHIDGACSGNPGRVGIGYVIEKDKTLIKEESLYLGVQTNNFAEYMALIFSLVDVLAIDDADCHVYSDSQLLCEQITGNYRVKNNNIIPLYALAKRLIARFDKFTITHIDRELNGQADALAKKGTGFLV